ncbi:MAG: hypothetical protein KF832_16205 [Caldilineaceae bacterium]|nr:hypothetical protein [Caldilineaceae bacterium]
MATVTIQGTVTDAQRQPLRHATVHLLSDLETLGTLPQANVVMRSGITWTRRQQGVVGHRWHAYTRYVAREVAGIGYERFKTQIAAYNPTLAESNYHFDPGQYYYLPANLDNGVAVAWSRPLRGFVGTLWQCWQRYVAGKVIGVTWQTFQQTVGDHNPELVADDYRFQAQKSYWLPLNPFLADYEVVATTSATGRYRFDGLFPGTYQIMLFVADTVVYTASLAVTTPTVHDIPLYDRLGAAQMDGFIRVNGKRFMQNGQPLRRFVGVNITGLLHYGESYTDESGHVRKVVDHSTANHRQEAVDLARAAGARVVRLFLPHYSCPKEEVARRLRLVLALLPEQMYILPAFVDFYHNRGFYPFPKADVDQGFYFQPQADGYRRLNPAFFKPPYCAPYLQLVDHIVAEFRGEPRIFAWEIGNELKIDPSDSIRREDFIQFNHMVAERMKQADANHLVTTGMKSTQHPHMIDHRDLAELLYGKRRANGERLIDFVTIHSYVDPHEPAVERRGFELDAQLAKALDMPVINEESGVNKGVADFRANLEGHMDRWFNLGPDSAMAPVYGFLQWGFCPPGIGDGDGGNHSDMTVIKEVYGRRSQLLAV